MNWEFRLLELFVLFERVFNNSISHYRKCLIGRRDIYIDVDLESKTQPIDLHYRLLAFFSFLKYRKILRNCYVP